MFAKEAGAKKITGRKKKKKKEKRRKGTAK
jgi:hypothetical protein